MMFGRGVFHTRGSTSNNSDVIDLPLFRGTAPCTAGDVVEGHVHLIGLELTISKVDLTRGLVGVPTRREGFDAVGNVFPLKVLRISGPVVIGGNLHLKRPLLLEPTVVKVLGVDEGERFAFKLIEVEGRRDEP